MPRSRIFRQLAAAGGGLVLGTLLTLMAAFWFLGALDALPAAAVLVAAALGLAAALLGARVLARRRTQPLRELVRATEHIAAGDYQHRIYVDDGDLIGQLGRAFNKMSERLGEQFARLDED